MKRDTLMIIGVILFLIMLILIIFNLEYFFPLPDAAKVAGAYG